MHKKIKIIFLMAVIALTTFAQQEKPLKLGIELDGKLSNLPQINAYLDQPTGAAYLGAFAEYHLTNHFSGKLKVGLNNIFAHQLETSIGSVDGSVTLPDKKANTQTLEAGIEPRFYVFSTERFRKTNFFVAVPVMFESKSLGKEKWLFQTKIKVAPTLGFRYDFSPNWGIEVNAGGVWKKYSKGDYTRLDGVIERYNGSTQWDYNLSLGVRYTF
jgi:hypothetical protein